MNRVNQVVGVVRCVMVSTELWWGCSSRAHAHLSIPWPLQLTVKGLVRLERLGPFFEELRSASRHRTLSLALLRAPPDSSPSASGLLAKVRPAVARDSSRVNHVDYAAPCFDLCSVSHA
jgi:hypothetical protein